jgi:uncharacterized protein YndB with AHSA1/START domain/effector-binding domain-containing protein
MSSKTLEVATPSDREIRMTRVFDAPRRLVWEALTRPALVKRWGAGPPGWEMEVCEIDLRVGGSWRWVLRGPGGEKMGVGGVYREIVPQERLASTEVFDEPWYPGEAVNTQTLEERGARTTLATTVRYASREARDAVLRTPMAEGFGAGMDHLEAVLATLGSTETAGIDAPRILRTTAQPTAVIHCAIPRDQIREVMGPGLAELNATLAAQGVAPTGRWFTRHFRFDPGRFDFEIGVPVAGPVREVGRVKNSELPAVEAARTVYRGGYEGLANAWPALDSWVASQGRKPAVSLWEVYLTDPSTAPDAAGLETELTRPLAG